MLDYFALGLLVFVGLVLFYGIIVIHDIPYEIAQHRNHPHQDAIHVAGWVSLMTLHVLWPFLWIWATLYREDRGWGFSQPANAVPGPSTADSECVQKELSDLRGQLQELIELRNRVEQLENASVATEVKGAE